MPRGRCDAPWVMRMLDTDGAFGQARASWDFCILPYRIWFCLTSNRRHPAIV